MSKKVKVEMLTSIAGNPDPRYGPGDISFSIGEIVELHPDQAKAWIAGGLAKLVNLPTPEPETTALEPSETVILSEAKPRRGRPPKQDTESE